MVAVPSDLPLPPATNQVEVLHLFRWFTHTPSRRRVEKNEGPDNEMKMKKKGNENEEKVKMR